LCFKKEKVSKHDLFIFALGGLFGFLITQILFAIALRYTTPVYFSLIMALTPVMVLGLSFFFLKYRKSTRLNSSHVSISYAFFCIHLLILFPYTTLFRSGCVLKKKRFLNTISLFLPWAGCLVF